VKVDDVILRISGRPVTTWREVEMDLGLAPRENIPVDLKRGDEVMTEGGIIGSVVHMQDDRVTLKSGEARIVVARVKITRVLGLPEPEKP